MEKENSLGQVRIADEVIEIIAELALNDISGIYSTAKTKGRKNQAKSIEVKVVDGQVTADIEVFVSMNVKIPVVAEKVQNKVKAAIENMTGLQVSEVNVRIVGLIKEDAPEE
ncbi:MAG: Asp23/Gls24 family envelope stress response protein [Firmicutes bacterium]|nr:Asp23/Gls24 family envelope stress response protein [Bacillota bacterium]